MASAATALENGVSESEESEESEESLPKRKKSLLNYTDSGDSSDSTSPGTRSAAFIEREIPLYRAENEVKRSGDPLLWWKRNEHRFQTLAKLA